MLTGVLPLALFVLLHLALQASALSGGTTYARVARFSSGWVWSAAVFLLAYLPLVVHSAFGFWLMFSRQGAEQDVPERQIRLVVVFSGLAVLAFLGAHWFHFRYPLLVGELRTSELYTELTASLSSTTSQGVPLVALGYVVGIAATMLHLYYGVCGLLAEFELADNPTRLRQVLVLRRFAYGLCCFGFFVGTATVITLATGSWLPSLW